MRQGMAGGRVEDYARWNGQVGPLENVTFGLRPEYESLSPKIREE
jgi:hypothetical protein